MFKIKIDGLDKLQRDLADAEHALKSLSGTIAVLQFDPNDASSVDAAVRQMERAVDSKVGAYRQNEILRPIVAEAKKRYKDEILERARRERQSAVAHPSDDMCTS